MLDSITDHLFDGTAVTKQDQFVVTKRGRKKIRQTTRGWDLCVVWRDGSEQWVPLKDIKESNPVEVAEYARAARIHEEPAFAWWVPFTLRKRDRIIAAVQHRVRRQTHKYGIKVPRTVEEAYKLDKENGNTLWRDALQKK